MGNPQKELVQAAYEGDLVAVKKALAEGAKVNERTLEGEWFGPV